MKLTAPDKVYQYDINQRVSVSGIEIVSQWQAHFAKTGSETALVLEIHETNGEYWAYIPNQLVELGAMIYCYLYNVTEDKAYTDCAISIPIIGRPKPDDYISEPTDVITWSQLRADIGTLSELGTEHKENLVYAVNEVLDKANSAASDITDVSGALSQLSQDVSDVDTKADTNAASISDINESISEINAALDGKQPVGEYITKEVDNLANYYKKSETYTQSEINNIISSMTHITTEVVDSIADVTKPNVIYLIPAEAEADNYYEEYLLINGKPELIGTTRVDLSGYYTKTETDSLLDTKQPTGNYVTSVNSTTPDESGNIEIAVTNPIDDGQVSSNTTWSSLNIIQKLTTPFTETGNTVTCYPVEGSPLYVVSDITAVQAGTGDPSPDNVRPISGWDSAILYVGTNEYSKDFPETVYGGTLDWTTGVLTVTYKSVDMSTLSWGYNTVTWGKPIFTVRLDDKADGNNELLSPFYKWASNVTDPSKLVFYEMIGYTGDKRIYICDDRYSSTSEYKAALSGIPLVYMLANPYTIQLTPTQILAISGLNTIYCDTGDITVTGYENPRHTVAQLTSRIAALENTATGI